MGEKTKSPQKTSQKVQSRQEDRQALVTNSLLSFFVELTN